MSEYRVRPADTLVIDRLLNRKYSVDKIHMICTAALEATVPIGYIHARIKEREAQAAIAAALPPGVAQRTPEWYAARDKIVTASEFHQAAFGTDAAKRAFIAKKVGTAPPFTGNEATRWGVKYEDLARLLYEQAMGCSVREHGLLLHPTEAIVGASPDGVTPYALTEYKTPFSKKLHEIPNEYFAQMQGQMEVLNMDACDFVVCRVREFPESDEFWSAFQAAYDIEYGWDRFGSVGSKHSDEEDKLVFVYSMPGISPDDLRLWIKETEADGYACSLHHVFELRITRVNRDDDYIRSMIAGLNDTWARVEEARRNPKSQSRSTAGNDYQEPPVLRGFSFRQPR